MAVALTRLGECARVRGQTSIAERSFLHAAELGRAHHHPYPLVLALLGLVRIAQDQGEDGAAEVAFAAAVYTARAHSLRFLLAHCLCGLAEVAAEVATPRRLIEEASAEARAWGDTIGEALALESSARLRRRDGDVKGAAFRHRQALRLRAQVGDPAAIADSLEALAGLAAYKEDFSIAARLFGRRSPCGIVMAVSDPLLVRATTCRPSNRYATPWASRPWPLSGAAVAAGPRKRRCATPRRSGAGG
jgi:ATP/maltotriose-dependent transcriptional regulator MalT